MRNFVKYIGVILLSVLLFTAVVNYLVDPAHILDDEYVNNMMTGIRHGKNITNVTNFDDRKFREELVKFHSGETYDYIILGSSRSNLISKEALSGKKLLNLSVNSARLEDLAAIYQLCEDFKIKYRSVLIAADFIYLRDNNTEDLWKTLQKYYNEYMHIAQPDCHIKRLAMKLFSFTYLHECLQTIVKGRTAYFHGNNLMYTYDWISNGLTYRLDGSRCYGVDIAERAQSAVDSIAKEDGDLRLNYKVSIDNEILFDAIIKSYCKKGKVIFYLPPVHPAFYARWQHEMPELLSAASWIKGYAKANDIPVIGDFNPSALGLDSSNFYDGVHCKYDETNILISEGLNRLGIE
jgi:hypothetical protein